MLQNYSLSKNYDENIFKNHFINLYVTAQVSYSVMALIECKRCCRTEPPKIHQKVPPLHKIFLYFFIGAPGLRWNIKKKIRKCSITGSSLLEFSSLCCCHLCLSK